MLGFVQCRFWEAWTKRVGVWDLGSRVHIPIGKVTAGVHYRGITFKLLIRQLQEDAEFPPTVLQHQYS